MKRYIAWVWLFPLLVACTAATPTMEPTTLPADDEMEMDETTGMDGMGSEPTEKFAPTVHGFFDGSDLLFIHTEASDAGVAEMLTDMMGGPLVVLVPELAQAPDDLLANVYVFTNGIEGMGPFGYQPDIFDSVPGEEAYRPLRRINLVEWKEGNPPRELRSLAELEASEAAGEVSITQPDIVVNMPILAWPGGSR